jgi:hypothetical protein
MDESRVVPTYDLMNAGPRQRFTVRGRNGEILLVHNCQNIAEGVGRDLLVHAMLAMETAGADVIGSVHDEGIFEVDEGSWTVEKAIEIFVDKPKWAKGLPIAAEGFIAKRYRK